MSPKKLAYPVSFSENTLKEGDNFEVEMANLSKLVDKVEKEYTEQTMVTNFRRNDQVSIHLRTLDLNNS